MKNLLTLSLLIFFVTILNGQDIDKKTHRKNIRTASKFFENGSYQEAATAFQQIIDTSPFKLASFHMMEATFSFAHLKDEKMTRDYLQRWTKIATNDEIKEIRTVEVLHPFRSKKWWPDFDASLTQRIDDLIQHHKNLKIFSQHKKMTYTAIRITEKGDTVANTKIHILPAGTGWGSPTASSQSEVRFLYESTDQDSIDHIQELRDIIVEKFWNNIDDTGVIENEEEVWMHPFRNNEFFKTEIAPFPVVHFPINYETMLKARSKIVIMKNWGTYSPSMTEQKYFYAGTEDRDYDFEKNVTCHKFESYAHNSVHGISYLEYFFHPEHGFTEMNYLTYDNDVIEFKLVSVTQRK